MDEVETSLSLLGVCALEEGDAGAAAAAEAAAAVAAARLLPPSSLPKLLDGSSFATAVDDGDGLLPPCVGDLAPPGDIGDLGGLPLGERPPTPMPPLPSPLSED